MSALFHTIFFQPIFNVLIWLYASLPYKDIGIAIIILTLLVKVITYPLALMQIKQQREMQELQPKIDEVRTRLKDDQDAQAKELMELYKKEKVNPAAGCWPLLVQIPIFIALYQALRVGLNAGGYGDLYAFVPTPTSIQTMFLGIFDLTKPNYVLAVLAGLVQFFQTKHILKPPAATVTPPPSDVAASTGAKDESMAAMMNKQMTYVMPLMTVFIGISLPGGLTLYWLTMSALTLLQQVYVLRRMPPKIEPQLKG
ncbi:MAG: YidC/Oxa1 family membrane protein insertase [Patescibacteria group bacterium]